MQSHPKFHREIKVEIKRVGLRSRLTYLCHFCVLEQGTLLPESTGNTQEVVVPSRHDGTTVDWHVKPEEKKQQQQTNKEDMYMISQRSSSLKPSWCSDKVTRLVKWGLWV